MNRVILGIETTCDDTGIGVLYKNKIVSNKIISSFEKFKNYGGVVPEIAARSHEENLLPTFVAALKKANINEKDITHIAYANQPGLPGCLHVGKVFAKTLSFTLNVPLIPVNHLYSHIFSASINQNEFQYPALGLVVSGGHTSIYLVNSPIDIILLDETLDDAIGEVYDKVGRALGLSYPAGPLIDKMFDENLANSIKFLSSENTHVAFSYSGIKTAVLNYINKNKLTNIINIASSFQFLIINDFIKRVKKHIQNHSVKLIALGGGVSANSYLRKQLNNLNLPVLLPQMEFTNDNGAMHSHYANILLDVQ